MLFDVCVLECFCGDVEFVDVVVGYIFGVINVFSGSVLVDDGMFFGNGVFNVLLFDYGIDYGGCVGVYCGLGVSVVVIVVVLVVIG